VLISIAIVPPLYAEADAALVATSLHALARRFERGEPVEAAVLHDLRPLVQAYPRAVAALAADFRVECIRALALYDHDRGRPSRLSVAQRFCLVGDCDML
jgi:hypothetical protein